MATLIQNYTYKVIYVKGEGYYAGGTSQDAEFSKNIDGACTFHADSLIVDDEAVEVGGVVEEVHASQSIQVIL